MRNHIEKIKITLKQGHIGTAIALIEKYLGTPTSELNADYKRLKKLQHKMYSRPRAKFNNAENRQIALEIEKELTKKVNDLITVKVEEMDRYEIKKYVMANFHIATPEEGVVEVGCITDFDEKLLNHIKEKVNVEVIDSQTIKILESSGQAIRIILRNYFYSIWEDIAPKRVKRPKYCDVFARGGNVFVAKVREVEGCNEPYEVRVNGEWITIEEFYEIHNYYSCKNYREYI